MPIFIRQTECYEKKKRLNNPPVGLVRAATDKDEPKKTSRTPVQ